MNRDGVGIFRVPLTETVMLGTVSVPVASIMADSARLSRQHVDSPAVWFPGRFGETRSMYFDMACRLDPFLSFNATIAAVITCRNPFTQIRVDSSERKREYRHKYRERKRVLKFLYLGIRWAVVIVGDEDGSGIGGLSDVCRCFCRRGGWFGGYQRIT
ncbi:hypothetical protein U1Q18_023135 [Sarracenia purpurea var. burkii]